MLKPIELKEKEFELSVLGGYKREDVDAFFAAVSSSYEALFNENAELVQKLKACVAKIEEYQKDEQFLKAAIINAEKLNETTLKNIEEREKKIEQEAKEKADVLVAKAKLEAENIVNTARAEAAESIRKCEIETAEKIAELTAKTKVQEEILEQMKIEVSEFKDSVLKIYKKHIEVFSKIPEYQIQKSVEKPVETVVENTVVNETPKESVPVFEEVKEEVPVVTTESTTETTKSSSDKTAEFVIEKKKPSSDADSDSFDQNFKFKGLKFGADFDIKKDK